MFKQQITSKLPYCCTDVTLYMRFISIVILQSQNMVMKEKFDSICQELSKALSREQQAQELLNEQSSQLEELGMRLNIYTTDELEKDATITEAVKV